MILSLAPAGSIPGLPTMALFIFVLQAARVEVARALADGEQVAGSFTLVDSKLAGCVLDALPLLQKPAGSSWPCWARWYLLSTLALGSPPPSPAIPLKSMNEKGHAFK